MAAGAAAAEKTAASERGDGRKGGGDQRKQVDGGEELGGQRGAVTMTKIDSYGVDGALVHRCGSSQLGHGYVNERDVEEEDATAKDKKDATAKDKKDAIILWK
ncbi:hypothetical protein PInf_008280 [Phytophthora infestans]|nr:hypothetical protein PInf_008280 [Phytophthora infestans]